MKRLLIFALLLGVGVASTACVAQAQTIPLQVYLKGKAGPSDLMVTKESIQGIQVAGKAEVIPALDIEDIDYGRHLKNQAEASTSYSSATNAEKEAPKKATPVQRNDLLELSIGKFQQSIKEMPETLYAPRRHAEFKAAYLTGLIGLGSDKGAHRLEGIKKLNEFHKNHPDAWQTTPALMMLIRLYGEAGNFDGIKTTVAELNKINVPARTKHEGRMLAIGLMMDAGNALLAEKKVEATEAAEKKYAEAQQELKALLPELPAGSPLKLHAQLALAQTKAISKDEKIKQEATNEMETLLKNTTEKELRAMVYNSLGEMYLNEGKLQEARWQFLWVDVIYNQDKAEHARSLFYLWKIFNSLNEPERGQEFFETLTTDPRFMGTAFRDRALRENKQKQ